MPGWLEVLIRSFISLVVVLFGAKLFVRKALGELSYFEFMAAAVVAIIAGVGSITLSISPAYLVIALLVWLIVPYLIGWLSIKSPTFRQIVSGKGIPIIKDGKILEEHLKKQRYSTDELLSKLRAKNTFKVADVEFAVLEPNGNINLLLKKEKQPLSASDLGLKVAQEKETQTVIMDGKILDEPLASLGLNRRWLEAELEKIGVALENVFLGQVDSYGELTVDLYDDKIKAPQPVEKPLLAATIKKVQADLEGFALQTESKEAKKLYERAAKDMQEVMNRLKPFLH